MQREILIDERNGRLYGPFPFLLARALPDLVIMRIVPSILCGVILFHMLGYQDGTESEYLVTVSLLASASSVFVFAISCVSPDSYMAGLMAIFSNLTLILYGGLFIQNDTKMPWYVRWPKTLSFYNQAYEILFVNELHGLDFGIDDAEVSVNGQDFDTDGLDVSLSGDFFIDFFGFNRDRRGRDYALLITWIAVYFGVGILALQFLHRSKR